MLFNDLHQPPEMIAISLLDDLRTTNPYILL